MKNYKYSVGDTIGQVKIIKYTRNKKNEKSYIVQSIKYPDAPTYTVAERKLHDNYKDPYVLGRRIYEGNSLWSVVALRPYIEDIEKAKTIPKYSSQYINIKCPNCGVKFRKSAHSIMYNGCYCLECSTISKPERIFLSYLKYINIEYEYQKIYNDLPHRIFDFKLILNGKTILIETHGMQHYTDIGVWDYSKTVKSDEEKRRYAKDKGIPLLEIDCSSNTFNAILNNINKEPLLPSINEKDKEDLVNIYLGISNNTNLNSIYAEKIIQMYADGKSSTEIGNMYGIHKNKVLSILHNYGINVRKNNKIPPKKVQCITDGNIFNSTKEAGKYYNIGSSSVSKACRGVIKYTKKGGIRYWKYI